MPSPSDTDITLLLQAAHQGDKAAYGQLFPLIYEELRRLARKVRRSGTSDTLNTTALVHEAYLKLIPGANVDWQNRAHFFAIAARAMRQVAIKHAEKQMAQKRGRGISAITFNEDLAVPASRPEEVLALDEALQLLEKMNVRHSQIVEYRFFGGLTIQEVATILDVSERTIKRDWKMARAWLSQEIRHML